MVNILVNGYGWRGWLDHFRVQAADALAVSIALLGTNQIVLPGPGAGSVARVSAIGMPVRFPSCEHLFPLTVVQ
ncbi:hypothetical protein GF380_05840 [Candidatus Uhrbacteria bacterium]|nr:hypothetical protein [Candidatus Uhrbacteria bacterium]MBD3284512.1 hypothetical protein [Candidatus Uhrbacteria bacterium]